MCATGQHVNHVLAHTHTQLLIVKPMRLVGLNEPMSLISGRLSNESVCKAGRNVTAATCVCSNKHACYIHSVLKCGNDLYEVKKFPRRAETCLVWTDKDA